MNVTVNGDARELTLGTTVLELIQEFNLKPEVVAAQVNDTILNRDDFTIKTLEDGDVVELIRIVGGG